MAIESLLAIRPRQAAARISWYPPGNRGRIGQGVLYRRTPCRHLSEDVYGSRKFPGNPSASLPCSQTPVGLPRQAFAACRCGPRPGENEGTGVEEIFEAQSQGFDARCLRFVPPSRTTTQNSLPVVANLSGTGLVTCGQIFGESVIRVAVPPCLIFVGEPIVSARHGGVFALGRLLPGHQVHFGAEMRRQDAPPISVLDPPSVQNGFLNP